MNKVHARAKHGKQASRKAPKPGTTPADRRLLAQAAREENEASLPSFLVEVAGVGVCQNDLHFLASTIARGFGGGGWSGPESPIDIVKSAARQATIDLRVAADKMSDADNSDEFFSLLGIVERLESAVDSAEILFKLLQLPHVNMRARTQGEAQP